MTFTQYIHSRLYKSGAASTFTMVWKHHPYVFPAHSRAPENRPCIHGRAVKYVTQKQVHKSSGCGPSPSVCVFAGLIIFRCRQLATYRYTRAVLSELTCLLFPPKGNRPSPLPSWGGITQKTESCHSRGHDVDPTARQALTSDIDGTTRHVDCGVCGFCRSASRFQKRIHVATGVKAFVLFIPALGMHHRLFPLSTDARRCSQR